MKKQLNKLRRFFARPGGKKLNAATARDAASASYEDEDNSSRLSGAFIVVLVLHVVALVGVFFYQRALNREPGAPAGGKEAANIVAPAAADHGAASPSTSRPAPQTPPAPAVAQAPDRPSLPTPAPFPLKTNGRNSPMRNAENFAVVSAVQSPPDARTTPRPTEEKNPTPGFYTVKKGDTLAKIARDHGVSSEELSKLNHISDPKKIQLNQKLKIPSKK